MSREGWALVPGSRTIMKGVGKSRWGWLIMLILLVVFGLVVWGILHTYHLMTAFVGFIGGLILAWFGSNLIPEDERGEHAFKLMLIPIVLAVLGYFLEFFNIYRVPLSFTLPLKALMFASDVVISLDTLLLLVVVVCVIVQLVITVKKR